MNIKAIKAENKEFAIEEKDNGVSIVFKQTQPYKAVRLNYESLASLLTLLDSFCANVVVNEVSGTFIKPKNNGEKKHGDFPRVS